MLHCTRPGRTLRGVVLAICLALVAPALAQAAKVRVLATQALTEAFPELNALLERSTGDHASASFGTTGALSARVERGEQADVVILTHAAVDKLVKAGQLAPLCLAPGSDRLGPCQLDVARARVVLAARARAAKPDISSPEAFRSVLLGAGPVAYPDPADGGASGIALVHAAEQLGVLDRLRAASVLAKAGASAGAIVAAGQAQYAVQMLSELIAVPGIEIVGPLPEQLAQPLVFTVGLLPAARDSKAARAFVDVLRTPEAGAILRKHGFEPI